LASPGSQKKSGRKGDPKGEKKVRIGDRSQGLEKKAGGYEKKEDEKPRQKRDDRRNRGSAGPQEGAEIETAKTGKSWGEGRRRTLQNVLPER